MSRQPSPPAEPPAAGGYRRGSAGYRSITLALFAAGMTTFAAMYAPQAVLPDLTTEFGIGAGAATLAVSATTGLLALAIMQLLVPRVERVDLV